MGNTSSNQPQFNALKYSQNSGLSIQEVESIKKVFDAMEPKDGTISTDTLRKLYRHSHDAAQLDSQIGNQERFTFDEFFELMRRDMIDKKQRFPGVEFNDLDGNAQCCFCMP